MLLKDTTFIDFKTWKKKEVTVVQYFKDKSYWCGWKLMPARLGAISTVYEF